MISTRAMWWLDLFVCGIGGFTVTKMSDGNILLLLVVFLLMLFQYHQGRTEQARADWDRIRNSPAKPTGNQDEQVASDQSEVGVRE